MKRRTVLGTDGRECYGSSSGCSGVDPTAVAGRFVAYGTYECCSGTADAFFTLQTRDLRTGRQRFLFRAGQIAAEQAYLGRIVIRKTGTAAWTMSRLPQAPREGPKVIEVRRSPGCGSTLLASGPGIHVNSLARVGSRVVWRDGSRRFSAALC